MPFNSLEFGVFFAIVFSLYLVLPRRGQNRMLLVASYVFYGAWSWKFLSLIAISTGVDYLVGRALGRSTSPQRRKQLVLVSLATNLGILGFFKYAGFFAGSLQELFAGFGITLPAFALDVVLPVGISFYTFQTLGYSIDVYRGRVAPADDFLDFALYVAFFPQLVAGPIERAGRLLPQILSAREVTAERLGSGSWLILWGLYKKVVIADNLALLVDLVYGRGSEPVAGEVLVATWAFAFQIYCDFSGYTDIARGLARVMGFDLMLNFRLPYAATSPSDFWRRWHISLSTWLRDYLYISLGGNRRGSARRTQNLMITMLLGGLWHGAAMPFVIWGAYHGICLIAHRALAPALERLTPTAAPGRVAWHALRVLVTFHLVCLGWLIFRSADTAQIITLLSTFQPGAGSLEAGAALQWLRPFLFIIAPLIAMQIAQAVGRDLEIVLRWPPIVRCTIYLGVLLGIALMGEPVGRPFVYFQF